MIEKNDVLCQYCNKVAATQWHHVIYPSIKRPLCDYHHRKITKINTLYARKVKRPLNDWERLAIYTAWLYRLMSADQYPEGFNRFWLNGPESPETGSDNNVH
jgi:hypothetical protein